MRLGNVAETVGRWLLNRAGSQSTETSSKLIAPSRRMLEWFNPLRGLTITRATQIYESYNIGDYAQPLWLFHSMERCYPTLVGLIERRTSAVVELEWEIRTVDEGKEGEENPMAQKQAEFLKAAYSRIDNMTEAVEALAMASFRGFSLLEKQDTDGDGLVDHFGLTDGWNWVRDGLHGRWYWNPDATFWSGALSGKTPIEEDFFLIRTVPRPIDLLALNLFCRSALGEKDWASFLEIFAVPGGVVIGPPSVPEKREAEYAESGRRLAAGGVGYLPNGSEYKPNNPPHEGAPFETFLRYQQEQLVLAGTGGLLTMLTESGSGTLAGSAHSETFDKIARAEGSAISSLFQRQMDKPLLAAQFPGQPVLAYFELNTRKAPSTDETISDVKGLAASGWRVEGEQIEEITGYRVIATAGGASLPMDDAGNPVANDPTEPITNRAGKPDFADEVVDHVARAAASDLAPIRDELKRIAAMTDPVARQAAITKFLEDAPTQAKSILSSPESAEALANAMATGYVNGLAKAKVKT